MQAVNRRLQHIIDMQQCKPAIFICGAVGLLALTACAAQYPLNPKVDVIGRTDPYHSRLHHIDRSDPLFLIIAFSGGVTRAASLAYGTLEAC